LSLTFESDFQGDVYFVFKNAEASGGEIMMGVTEMEFYNKARSGGEEI